MQLSKVDGMGVADIYLVIIIGICRAFYHHGENFIKFDPAKINGDLSYLITSLSHTWGIALMP